MRFTCPTEEFKSVLQIVIRAVSPRSSWPIVQNLLIEASASLVRLTGTDLELALTCAIEAEVAEEGQITLPAKMLADIVGGLTGESITVTVGDTLTGELKCGRSRYQLLGLPPEEYPPLPEVGGDTRFEIAPAELARLLRCTTPFVSSDDTRTILTAVCVTLGGDSRSSIAEAAAAPTGGTLRCAATDTHRLAVISGSLLDSQGEQTVLLPGRACTELQRLVDGDTVGSAVLARIDANQARFETSRGILTTRLVSGQFPRFERVVPKEEDAVTHITVDAQALGAALKRLLVIARENSHRVQIATGDGILTLSAQAGTVGKADEEVEAVCSGEAMEVTLNVLYLRDICSVAGKGTLEWGLSAPLAPVRMSASEQAELVMICMPMNVS